MEITLNVESQIVPGDSRVKLKLNCFKKCFLTVCSPKGSIALIFSYLFLLVLVGLFLWGLCGKCMLPPSNLFLLLLIFALSNVLGILAKLVKLPDLLGMLLSGFIIRNIPQLHAAEAVDSSWMIALTVILIKAGMGLDAKALRKLSCAVFRLAFTPCLVEMFVAAVVSHFVLSLPWLYSLILGSVLAAVSPAVVVPCLLYLSVQGYGIDKGIPTLVIAASSIDDILAISCFGIFIGINFATGSLWIVVLKAPFELFVGTLYGILFGLILRFIPHQEQERKTVLRFILLMMIGLVGLFCSQQLDIGGAGPFAALVLGFIVQIYWRKEENNEETVEFLEIAWNLFKPFLFSLIGFEISLSQLDYNVLGLGIAVLAICLAFRMLATFVVTFGNNFTIKEKLFITISWLPKATVQAAIGGIALDMCRSYHRSLEEQENARKIVTIAVLSIVLTAPLGAVFITLLGPAFLQKSSKVGQFNQEDENPVILEGAVD